MPGRKTQNNDTERRLSAANTVAQCINDASSAAMHMVNEFETVAESISMSPGKDGASEYHAATSSASAWRDLHNELDGLLAKAQRLPR